jgi:hypothetical protein
VLVVYRENKAVLDPLERQAAVRAVQHNSKYYHGRICVPLASIAIPVN